MYCNDIESVKKFLAVGTIPETVLADFENPQLIYSYIRYLCEGHEKVVNKIRTGKYDEKELSPQTLQDHEFMVKFYKIIMTQLMDLILFRKEKQPYTLIHTKDFDGDILITDPCYVVKDDDWGKSYGGEALNRLGISNFITSSTFYGDWSCTVYKAQNISQCISENKIGEFCADSALVSVIDYAQAIQYNKNLSKWVKEHDWCAAVIKNFHGTIEMRRYDDYYMYEGKRKKSYKLEIYGIEKGKVKFITIQTGL